MDHALQADTTPADPRKPRVLTFRALARTSLVLILLAVGTAAGPAGAAQATTRTSVVAPVAPVAPAPFSPVSPTGVEGPLSGAADPVSPTGSFPVDLRKLTGEGANPIALALLLGLVSLLPALLIMVTAFTRIVIVLGFTRSALGTQGIPPNQVVIGLALFLTFFVMAPTFSQANDQALKPYLDGRITQGQAVGKAIEPFRTFMLAQVREKDLALFVSMSGDPAPATRADVPTTTLIPAFVISELRTAFLIGFVIFVPFIVIDLVISAALSAMGMVMLPPALISLPFKLLLFVAADGWYLVVESLMRSFRPA